jgi:head-tail adaptor
MKRAPAGRLRQRVTLETPGAPAPDGDGGAVSLWPPAGGVVLGARVPAAVDPVTRAQGLERDLAHTSEGVGQYTVTLRYLPGVTLATRVTLHDAAGDRPLYVTGITDPEQRHVELALLCTERLT